MINQSKILKIYDGTRWYAFSSSKGHMSNAPNPGLPYIVRSAKNQRICLPWSRLSKTQSQKVIQVFLRKGVFSQQKTDFSRLRPSSEQTSILSLYCKKEKTSYSYVAHVPLQAQRYGVIKKTKTAAKYFEIILIFRDLKITLHRGSIFLPCRRKIRQHI